MFLRDDATSMCTLLIGALCAYNNFLQPPLSGTYIGLFSTAATL